MELSADGRHSSRTDISIRRLSASDPLPSLASSVRVTVLQRLRSVDREPSPPCRPHRGHSCAWPDAMRPTGSEGAADVQEVTGHHAVPPTRPNGRCSGLPTHTPDPQESSAVLILWPQSRGSYPHGCIRWRSSTCSTAQTAVAGNSRSTRPSSTGRSCSLSSQTL